MIKIKETKQQIDMETFQPVLNMNIEINIEQFQDWLVIGSQEDEIKKFLESVTNIIKGEK